MGKIFVTKYKVYKILLLNNILAFIGNSLLVKILQHLIYSNEIL